MVGKQAIPEDKAKELRARFLGQDAIGILTIPTPEEWIRHRPIRGGGQVDYVPGGFFIQLLNDAFGFLWNFQVDEAFEKDGQVVVKGTLTVKIPGKTMVKEYPDGTKEIITFEGIEIRKTQFGGSEVKKFARDVKGKDGSITYKKGDVIDLGDDFKSAATDAMKKCATLLGIFLDIYGPREEEDEGKVSKQQLEAFYMRTQKAGMDESKAVEWCVGEVGKKPEECDPLELMGLIPKLLDMAKKGVSENA